MLDLLDLRLGVVASGDEIVVMTALLIEGAELNQTVAHHVGIRCQAGANLFHRVSRHLVPIFLVTVDDLQFAAVLMCNSRRHLQIFLRRTVPLRILFRTYFDIKAVRVEPELRKLIHNHTAVDTSRQKHRDSFIIYLLDVHIMQLFYVILIRQTSQVSQNSHILYLKPKS